MNVFKRPGSDMYSYKFVWNGVPIVRSTHQCDKKVAKDMGAKHRSRLAAGEIGIVIDRPSVTFKAQAEEYMKELTTREKPVRDPESLQGALDKWILPAIGHLQLEEVHNETVRALVETMKSKLAPKTIQNYVEIVKRVVGSLRDPKTRVPLYPRVWDSLAMNMPPVEARLQPRPAFSAAIVNSLIEFSAGQEQALYVLLAATGLRISEALAVETRHFLNDGRTIKVEQQVDRDLPGGGVIGVLKSNAAFRLVDLSSDVAEYFARFREGKHGLLFHTRIGTPYRYTFVQEYWLTPRLEALKVRSKGMGWHSFRRYRETYLQTEPDPPCNKGIEDYWIGHGPKNMSDLYRQLQAADRTRMREAERVGVGFEVPNAVPKVTVGTKADKSAIRGAVTQ